MVAYRLATGGFNGNVAAAITTSVISLATYLPVVFVMEEVLFRKTRRVGSSSASSSIKWNWNGPTRCVAIQRVPTRGG